MSTDTAGDVIDRLLRDYLAPPSDRPTVVPLATGVNDSIQTIVHSTGYLTVEEQDLLDAGSIIELGTELILVGSYDGTDTFSSCTRGYLGTTAATHTAGDIITIQPKWTRARLLDAVSDAIVGLYPTLKVKKTVNYDSADGYIEVAADVESVFHYRYADREDASSGLRYVDGGVEFLDDFPPASTNLKAIQLHGVPTGRTGYLTYFARFPRPSAESYDLSDNGLRDEWVELVVFGALMRITATEDLDQATQQMITDALEAQGFPPGAGEDLSRSLVRFYEYLLNQARLNFREEAPMTVEMLRP
ncbi:MAG: hypothetical protein R3320_12030 [Nitriliruptorales bacterium]|nr:hypothetical protein [Nitriliruptorales bacterium]